jgi:hypothetical protein
MAKKRTPAKPRGKAGKAGVRDDKAPSVSDNIGGLGGPSSIHPVGQRDTRLIERAIRQRWPVPEGCRQALIERQIKIATNPKSAPREATIAFKAILSAEAQNQADELATAKREQDDRHHAEGETIHVHDADAERDRLAALSKKLGLRSSLFGAAPVETRAVNGSNGSQNGNGRHPASG